MRLDGKSLKGHAKAMHVAPISFLLSNKEVFDFVSKKPLQEERDQVHLLFFSPALSLRSEIKDFCGVGKKISIF